jgi:hypothetical protein
MTKQLEELRPSIQKALREDKDLCDGPASVYVC